MLSALCALISLDSHNPMRQTQTKFYRDEESGTLSLSCVLNLSQWENGLFKWIIAIGSSD